MDIYFCVPYNKINKYDETIRMNFCDSNGLNNTFKFNKVIYKCI